MYHQEHQIAQAEHELFVAKFNRPAAEGTTVAVPNIFDRAIAAFRGLLTGTQNKRYSYQQTYVHGGAAK